jgi:hypothetical protein
LILRLLSTPEAGGFDIVTLRQSEELPSDGKARIEPQRLIVIADGAFVITLAGVD